MHDVAKKQVCSGGNTASCLQKMMQAREGCDIMSMYRIVMLAALSYRANIRCASDGNKHQRVYGLALQS